jgi:hypothetical protein
MTTNSAFQTLAGSLLPGRLKESERPRLGKRYWPKDPEIVIRKYVNLMVRAATDKHKFIVVKFLLMSLP